MYLVITASSDTYITDKVIDSKLRAEDANLGRAGTLDLFKLYNESTLSGTDNPNEISRLLLKFNYERIKELTGSILDLSHSSFNVKMELKNFVGGQTMPDNFTVIVHPLSKSFDEGIGTDVASFADLDACNFITSSYSTSGGANVWNLSGANKPGLLGSADIDIVSSGNLGDGDGVKNLFVTQQFVEGNEDLLVDITSIVSATIVGLMPDHGFRIAFSGSQEDDNRSRFVKRFASRHVRNKYLVPKLRIAFDDTVFDHHENFFFDTTGSIFLNNYVRGNLRNIVSGASADALTGTSCLHLTLSTGSFAKTVSASQHTAGTDSLQVSGVYSASFALDSTDATAIFSDDTIKMFVARSGSVTFKEVWSTTDNTIGYYTGSLTVKSPFRSGFDYAARKPSIKIVNASTEYKLSDVVRFRAFGIDTLADTEKPVKSAYKKKSIIYDEVYYRVRDAKSNDVIIPFERTYNATRLSTDSSGMFFDLRLKSLVAGRTYAIDFLIVDRGVEFVDEGMGIHFRVNA
jgi:hypothetical protein